MDSRRRSCPLVIILSIVALTVSLHPVTAHAATRVPVRVERHAVGAPLTFGLPLPKGLVHSPDHVRVVDPAGREVPAQVTAVTTWEPVDPSLKWIWVFFFAGQTDRYTIEVGDDVRRAPTARDPLHPDLQVVNSQRDRGSLEFTAGRLHVTVKQGDGGFISEAALDIEGDGFEADDVIAVGPQSRGGFVDLLDDAGLDPARAVVFKTFIERGSGPLHAVLRVEGEYRYGRPDNRPTPFVTRIHAYAGKSYLRVLHTFIYTGTPDKHVPLAGEFPHVATQKDALTKGDPADQGVTQPDDRIASIGLGLTAKLGPAAVATTVVRRGSWWAPGAPARVTASSGDGVFSIVQDGPRTDGVSAAPPPESPADRRQGGFAATVRAGDRTLDRAERADGWVDVSDGSRGIAIGMKGFIEEYPKEIRFDPATGQFDAFAWSPSVAPASFARMDTKPGAEGSVENWAQGLAKTSEFVLYFHDGRATADDVAATMRHLLAPSVAHAEPSWYASSGVYGRFAARGANHPGLERALDYKFDWVLFNQQWAPWFGLFDYGDVKVRYDGKWDMWGHNEPAQDFEVWMQFMRTGDVRYFDAAQAFSRHTMDVDNTHWPAGPQYRGDSNQSVDWFTSQAGEPATKWLGVGRRHSSQHWMHILSAHVWVQGWMADYYLAADHRALDVARQTADMHLRRMWGEHELTGRRLYLAAWNLAEVYDATKDDRYKTDLDDRVARMLRLQRADGDTVAMERYGYAQVYATHALRRYYDLTASAAVKDALVRHARRERDVPSLNHWMESFLASLHALSVGYELSGEPSFRDAIVARVAFLETDALPRPIGDASWTQATLAAALQATDHVPDAPDWYRREFPAAARARTANWDPAHGLRFFGWTTGHGLPWALAALDGPGATASARPATTPRRPRAAPRPASAPAATPRGQ